jgi:hypothetical protein
MVLDQLNIARDCWWSMPSGDTYVIDETGQLPSQEIGLYNSLDTSDSTYVEFCGSGTTQYFCRLDSSNVDISHVYVNIRADASTSGSATFSINDLEIGSFGHVESLVTQSGVFALDNAKRQRIFNGRISSNYDYFNIDITTPISSGEQTKRLYNLEVSYSGDNLWDNHETGLPTTEVTTFYPSALLYRDDSTWEEQTGQTPIPSGISDNDNNTYIEQTHTGTDGSSWAGSNVMPNGGLTIQFAPSGDPLSYELEVARARLNITMALPPSGATNNARDTFEVNGYNTYLKNLDNREELTYLETSQTPLQDKYGYFLYGAGGRIEAPDFTTYNVELNFLDPTLPSGDIDSIKHRKIAAFNNTEFQFVGLPSGVQISHAELQIEYTPNNVLGLYVAGHVERVLASSTVDFGTSESFYQGFGGWHHIGNSGIIEESIFDDFYTFKDTSGFYTYSEDNSSVYGEYIDKAPYDLPDTPTNRSPVRHDYYRNPLEPSGGTPPTYYQNMLYHGDSIVGTSLNDEQIYQVYFDDRIDLGSDFTLFFVLYCSPNEESYGTFFRRGLLEAQGAVAEIQGEVLTDEIKFTVYSSTGSAWSVSAEFDNTSAEPILVWFSCGYEAYYSGKTSLYLSVHDNVGNYFTQDWTRASTHFDGYRKEYSASNVKTVLGTLYRLTSSTQLWLKYYLNHVSICEFGYADRYIELDWELTNSTVQANYDTSSDDDKTFLSTRLCNSYYLDVGDDRSIKWNVPYGSGGASWSIEYYIDNWRSSTSRHSLSGPVAVYGNLVQPSAIYIDLDTTHNTDHPSGVTVYADIGFDAGGIDNWKVGHIEFAIPSGTSARNRSTISSHINWESGPIVYDDVDKINLILTTQYVDIGTQEYYGELNINGAVAYFDSFNQYIQPYNDLNLYTAGDPINVNNNINLMTQGHVVNSGLMDLYTSGMYLSSTGNLDLFIDSDRAGISYQTTLYTYAEGFHGLQRILLLDDGTAVLLDDGTVIYLDDGGGYYIPLYMVGTSGTTLIPDRMPLYINSEYDKAYTIPLYLKAPIGTINEDMNLYLYNKIPQNNLPLFMLGPSGINDDLNLYVRGLGTTDGAYPINNNMNLFMARESEATARSFPLFLQGPTNNSLNAFMTGHMVAGSSVPLFVSGSGGPTFTDLEFYTHGF